MKRFSEQLHTKALGVKLSAAERRELRERVLSYMEYHPLPQSTKAVASQPSHTLVSDPFTAIRFSPWRLLGWSGVVASFLIISVAYTAEHAMPGDVLYAVKVNVNEELRASLAFSPYEKITWETERLNRRIAEARVLANSGRLTGVVEEEMAEAVRMHGANARREIEALKQTNKDEAALASMQLATTLDVQSTALRMGKKAKGADEATATSAVLASAIEEEAQRSAEDSQEEALPAYDRLLAHVETDTTRARELLSTIQTGATDDEIKDISRRLEDVDRTLAETLSLAENDTDKARRQLADILRRTQRLIVFMTNIDVRIAMNVEDIVPVVPTNEERRTVITSTLASLDQTSGTLRELLEASSDNLEVSVAGKARRALREVESLQREASEALKSDRLDAAESKSREAVTLAMDALAIVEKPQQPSGDAFASEPVEDVAIMATTVATTTDDTLSISATVTEETGATSTEARP